MANKQVTKLSYLSYLFGAASLGPKHPAGPGGQQPPKACCWTGAWTTCWTPSWSAAGRSCARPRTRRWQLGRRVSQEPPWEPP